MPDATYGHLPPGMCAYPGHIPPAPMRPPTLRRTPDTASPDVAPAPQPLDATPPNLEWASMVFDRNRDLERHVAGLTARLRIAERQRDAALVHADNAAAGRRLPWPARAVPWLAAAIGWADLIWRTLT